MPRSLHQAPPCAIPSRGIWRCRLGLFVLALAAAAGLHVFPRAIGAVPTATFNVSTFEELNRGEPQGTFISSEGEIIAGRGYQRLKSGEISMVWSSTVDAKGTVYLGTGDQGHLLAVRNKEVKRIADLQGVLITSLAVGPGGKLLAGTMPEPRILEVDPQSGKWRQLAKLPANHVWALLYDPKAKRIFAASGSPGKVFTIPAQGGTPEVYYDPGEKHLLCLAREPSGALLVGSAQKAVLYRVEKKGRGMALQDFDANELQDIAITPQGAIYLAVNKFQPKTSGLPRFDRTKDGEGGTALTTKSKNKDVKVRAQELRPGAKTGKGAIFRISPRGTVDQVLALDKGYFTDLALGPDGVLWVAEGSHGKVYQIRPHRNVLTAFDFPERQVLTLAFSGTSAIIGTGDAGAVYQSTERPPADPRYQSQIFDAKFMAQWGNLHLHATGRIAVESRCGNTTRPDPTWSGWQAAKPLTEEMLRIASPPARYLQLRVSWRGAPKNVLRGFVVYYRPQNQRARISELDLEEPSKEGTPSPRSPKLKLKWKVENPDEDPLVYRLYQREELGMSWRRISGSEPIDKTEFEWDTEPVADGYYRIKVEASDEKANPPEQTLTDARISARLLVDNRKPDITSLTIRFPWVSGIARDSFSPINRIEYSLNGKPWRLIGPADGVYDGPVEAFRLRLPPTLKAGTHTLALRALDEAENMGVTQINFVR